MPVVLPFIGNRPPERAPSRMSTAGTPIEEPRQWSAEMTDVARHADRDAFLRIYDHFMPRLCRYLRGLGASETQAEDVAQEAMLRLWQHAGAYDPQRSAVNTWLFRIARNLRIDRLRHDARIGPEPEDALAEAGAADGTTVEDHAEGVQLRRRIDALSPAQARLVRMSYFEAKSHHEIATELGMPLGTVKSHLRRALQRLQGEMGEEP